MSTTAAAALALTCLLTAATGAAAGPAPQPAPAERTVHAEYFTGPHGHGRHTEVPAAAPDRITGKSRPLSAAETEADGDVVALSRTGPSADRLDVTVIGDGYTLAEQADFLADAQAKWADVTALEPYRSYTGLMNVWAVQAVSNTSGVSGDPTADVVRDTALGSYFWCDGIERLLCADLDKVKAYSDLAPATDLVVVVSNSTKYGGAGYFGLGDDYGFAGVSTLSSDHASSSLVAVHEIGHSIGLLADEYTYDTYGTYHGREVPSPNATIYDAARLLSREAKWYRWLGAADPAGGTVGTYEGADYYPYGKYRPTQTSVMRVLSNPEFNLPGREAMIAGFYRYADLLTAPTPAGGAVERGTRLAVQVAALPAGLSDVEVRWYVDGREVTRARGWTSAVPSALGVPADGRSHTVGVSAADATDSVRDPAVREAATESVSWTVQG